MRGCETKALSKEAPASLVPSFLDLLQPLSCVMTCPTSDSFVTALTGWAFARRRTVTGMILAAGAVGTGHKHHSACHRVFAAARWSLDELGLAVFGLILPLLEGVVLLAVDDTPARKRGPKAFGVGMHHDPLLSTRKTALTNWAHCWVVLWFSSEGRRHYESPHRPWYPGKTQASFADMLATLRCQSVRGEVLSMGMHGRGSRNVVKALLHAVKQAA